MLGYRWAFAPEENDFIVVFAFAVVAGVFRPVPFFSAVGVAQGF